MGPDDETLRGVVGLRVFLFFLTAIVMFVLWKVPASYTDEPVGFSAHCTRRLLAMRYWERWESSKFDAWILPLAYFGSGTRWIRIRAGHRLLSCRPEQGAVRWPDVGSRQFHSLIGWVRVCRKRFYWTVSVAPTDSLGNDDPGLGGVAVGR